MNFNPLLRIPVMRAYWGIKIFTRIFFGMGPLVSPLCERFIIKIFGSEYFRILFSANWTCHKVANSLYITIDIIFLPCRSLFTSFLLCVDHYSHHYSSLYIVIHIIRVLWRSLIPSFFFCVDRYSHYSSSVYIILHVIFALWRPLFTSFYFIEYHYSHHSSTV